MAIDHDILLRPLQQIDTSPVWAAGQNIRQDRQQTFENERQNRLEALAMQQFQETVKQNRLVNKRADFNAQTNRMNAEANSEARRMQAEEHAEQMKLLGAQVDVQTMQAETALFNQAANGLAMFGEVALGAIEAGQPVPDEVVTAMQETLAAAEQSLQNPQLKGIVSTIVPSFQKAVETGSDEDWMSVGQGIQRAIQFTAPPKEQISEYDRLRNENLQQQMDIRQTEFEQEQDDRQGAEQAKQGSMNDQLSLINRLLDDESGGKAATGRFGQHVGIPGADSDRRWAQDFDLLRTNSTLDKLSAFTGAISDAERRYAEVATGLDRGLSWDQMKQRLQQAKNALIAAGAKDAGTFGSGSAGSDGWSIERID